MEPFKIIGNVYYVGCFSASSHLIDTGEGLILIDTGYADTLFLLVNSIYKLGFKTEDVKYIYILTGTEIILGQLQAF